MKNFIRPESRFSIRGLRHFSYPDAPHGLAKKPICKPIQQNHWTTNDWTAIAWPINIQSATPDGKFGPARAMVGWGDCWFMASLAAVANDKEGHQILAESIKQVDGGYDVTFKALPNNTVFISRKELQALLKTDGGDADTRLMELAADKLFKIRGNFKSMFMALHMQRGMNRDEAKQCLQEYCRINGIQDPMTRNPMRAGGLTLFAFFMLTGMLPTRLRLNANSSSTTLRRSDVIRFLNQYITNDRDGASIVINGEVNPLGDESLASQLLVIEWDAIRTDISRDKRKQFRRQKWDFLNALDKWLETPDDNTWQALRSAAGNLRLAHANPELFVKLLDRSRISLRQNHRDMLQSGVQEVLGNGPGYIGFPGRHCGTIEGIDEAAGRFTYFEANYPTLVHTGDLSDLIQSIENGNFFLTAVEPTTGRNDRERFEHAGPSIGRRLSQLYNQVVRDGKIDQAESGSLADLMEIDDSAFRQVYDSDKNGLIDSDEVKTVKLRVDRWVEHFNLTPIW